MQPDVLVLGASGRFGHNAAKAFGAAGWSVRRFARGDDLAAAARGADVIVHGWNPLYTDWAAQVPGQTRAVIAAARAAGATVLLPGNVYVFGENTPAPWSESTPHAAQNGLGRVRIAMESAYRASGVRTIVLRAGDFIDTSASGNWFDRVLTKSLAQGVLRYPGDPDAAHAWGYLPDIARAAVLLAERRADLPEFCDVPFAGYTLTGRDLAAALERATGRHLRLKRFGYLPVHLARPFWPMARHLLEMRYLWRVPHRLDGTLFADLLPGFRATPLETALASAIPADQVAGGRQAGHVAALS